MLSTYEKSRLVNTDSPISVSFFQRKYRLQHAVAKKLYDEIRRLRSELALSKETTEVVQQEV